MTYIGILGKGKPALHIGLFYAFTYLLTKVFYCLLRVTARAVLLNVRSFLCPIIEPSFCLMEYLSLNVVSIYLPITGDAWSQNV